MAAVGCVMGVATPLQQDVVGLRKESVSKKLASAHDSVAVGASAGRSNLGIRAQQVQHRPVRPAVSFPLFPRNMNAYSGVSGVSTVPVVVVAPELEEAIQQKEKKVPIPALNIVLRSDLGVVMERRW